MHTASSLHDIRRIIRVHLKLNIYENVENVKMFNNYTDLYIASNFIYIFNTPRDPLHLQRKNNLNVL